jgi:threonine/homoserine/homoserine lactone efflux protein
MWRHAPEPMAMELAEEDASRSALGQVWRGIAAQLANPKPAVFFGTVFLTFLPPLVPFWAYGVILAIIFFNDTVWNVLVARIFSLDRTRAAYLGLKTLIDRTFGGLLGLMGLKLALT